MTLGKKPQKSCHHYEGRMRPITSMGRKDLFFNELKDTKVSLLTQYAVEFWCLNDFYIPTVDKS